MLTPRPAAGSAATGDGAVRGRSSSWPRTVLSTAPVVVIALYGAAWIALNAGGGRGSTHALFQGLALAETVVALLLRRRKPVGALAGIVAVYLVFALDPLLLPAVLFALLTVAMERDQRTAALAAAATAVASAAWPYLAGRGVSFGGYTLPRLAAFGIAVAVGLYLRAQRNRRAVAPAERPDGQSRSTPTATVPASGDDRHDNCRNNRAGLAVPGAGAGAVLGRPAWRGLPRSRAKRRCAPGCTGSLPTRV